MGFDFLLPGSTSQLACLLALPHSLICKAGISVRQISQVALRVRTGNCRKAPSPGMVFSRSQVKVTNCYVLPRHVSKKENKDYLVQIVLTEFSFPLPLLTHTVLDKSCFQRNTVYFIYIKFSRGPN